MYKLSQKSRDNIKYAHPFLKRIVEEFFNLQIMDISVPEKCWRTLDEQKVLMEKGVTSTLNSKHLMQSDGYSHAIDFYPYPIDMKKVANGDAREIARFGIMFGAMKVIANNLGFDIISGMDWNGNGETLDHKFFDAPHVELRIKEK